MQGTAVASSMVLDHVGIVVRSIVESIPKWESVFGYRQLTSIVTNSRQRVRVVFLAKDGSLSIKLVEPTDSRSAVHALAQRGGGLHHLCFRASSVTAEVARLRGLGLRILEEAQPGEAFEGESIAFVYAGDGLNVELIDTDRRASLLRT
jgi:methylmalonyl-CoA/ethylmalonyl-CoA epimerase